MLTRATKPWICGAVNFSYAARTLFALALLSASVSAQSPENEIKDDAGAPQFRAAQADDSSVLELPPDLPPLPGPREKDATLILNSKNVALFHELLLAPVAIWVKEGKFVTRVVRELDIPWSYPSQLVVASRENASRFALTSDGSLTTAAPPADIREGAPFGFAPEIDRERDPVAKARKILWNSKFLSQASDETLYSFDLLWFGTQGFQRRASGIFFSRRAPLQHFEVAPQGSSLGSDLLHQDLLQFLFPPVVFGFAEVSHRTFSPLADKVWIYSPVIGKSRSIFPSNRGDPLLGSLMTFDDFLVSSLKPQSVSAKVVDEKTILLPFSALGVTDLHREQSAEATASAGDGQPTPVPTTAATEDQKTLTARGSFKSREGQPAYLLWNSETGQYAQAPAWVPTTIFFVPRSVWIIEVTRSDPFYLLGKEILVVDKESQLPFYKIVYDRGGLYSKTLMASWVMASAEGDGPRLPVLAFMLTIDRQMKSGLGFSTSSLRYFPKGEGEKAKSYRALLDIAAHEKAATPTPSPSPGAAPDQSEKSVAEPAPDASEPAPVD